MAGNRIIQAIGPSARLGDRKTAVQRSINLKMTEVAGVGENKQVILQSVPGLVETIAAGGALRGSYTTESRAFYVVGSTFYEMTSSSTSVSRGLLVTNSGFVSMKHGVSQLVIVDGDHGYVFDLSTDTLTQITSAGWRGSRWVDYLDGYFVFVDPDTEQFYISAIDDGSSLDALDFSSADTQPDNIITHRAFKREVYFFGERSTEVWINSGDSDFPFTRYNATPIQLGTVGTRSVCVAADSLFFVGRSERGQGYVYQLNGYSPVRVSQQAVEEWLMASTDISQTVMWSFQIEGSEFVGVECPGMETTWVFDAASRQWFEMGRYVNGAWAATGIDHPFFWEGEHYCGFKTGVHRIDSAVYALGDESLVRERTWPHLTAPSLEPIVFKSLELQCTTGHMDGSSEAAVTLEISNDGGFTFGAPLQRLLGATGRWMQRVRWLFLGSSRDRVFRVRCTGAVPFTVYSAAIE